MTSAERECIHQLNLLVIDDDPEMCNLLEKVLVREDYHVQTACRGDDALKLLRQKEFDLIISDLKMPGLSGIELIRQAKAASPETPIILITAFGNVNAYIEVKEIGTYEFINKPIKMQHLKRVIQKALQEKEGKQNIP